VACRDLRQVTTFGHTARLKAFEIRRNVPQRDLVTKSRKKS
jgi:hypothetical protein